MVILGGEPDWDTLPGATPAGVRVLLLPLLLLAGGVGLFYSMKPAVPVTSPSEYTQITNFTDSAVAPSLSPDGVLAREEKCLDEFAFPAQRHTRKPFVPLAFGPGGAHGGLPREPLWELDGGVH